VAFNAAVKVACSDKGSDGVKNAKKDKPQEKVVNSDPPPPATQLEEAVLTMNEVVKDRYIPAGTDTPYYKFNFKSVYLDRNQPSATINLTPAVDSLTVDASGKSQLLRLFVKAKGLDEVILSFSGATLSVSNPASLPNYVTPVEKSPQPAASLTVTLPTVSESPTTDNDNSPPTVVDVPLNGLVATRSVTITAVGQKKGINGSKPTPVVGAVSVISVPVIAPRHQKPATRAGSVFTSP
jgi:hypothetical protein